MSRASPNLRRLLGAFSRSNASLATSTPVAPTPGGPRLRFAPSPTGFLHLGGLRTALFNHLLARKWKGKWILRIEDTDRTRLVPEAVDSLRTDLEWAGLDYDEGVGVGGSKGPYTQSERLDLYHEYTKHLLDQDMAYECFCTMEETRAIKMALLKQGHKHSYDGRCRHLTEEDRARRKRSGQQYTVRFKNDHVPPDIPSDAVYGDVPFTQNDDDFVIMKSDGWPTYHLASVVDDHEMDITHVLRGEEWLPSVPKHHALYRAFGWNSPEFAHLPLLVDDEGAKLSKRRGDLHIRAYREKGYEPEALLNFVALMGWDHHSAIDSRQQELGIDPRQPDEALPPLTRSDSHSYYDIFTVPQLISSFSLEHVNHKKAAVNPSKLDFINKMTLRRKAGRLGKDGVLVDLGKEASSAVVDAGSTGRMGMIARLQDVLREQKVLNGNALMEDVGYVGKVFDAELARTTLLKDMGMSSIFFFLEPQYDSHESTEMLKGLHLSRYVKSVEAVVAELESRLSQADNSVPEDSAWEAINTVLDTKVVKRRQDLLTPMRHALTGRKAGPSVPAIMEVLGKSRTLARLEDGLSHVRRALRSELA